MVQPTTPSSREADEVADGVWIAHLGHGKNLHATEVTIEPGTSADTHSHPHEQISYVAEGEVVMTVDGEEHRLAAGDAVHLPGETPHSATNQGEVNAIIIDMFTPPREDLLE